MASLSDRVANRDLCFCIYPDFNPDDPDITNCGACGKVLQ